MSQSLFAGKLAAGVASALLVGTLSLGSAQANEANGAGNYYLSLQAGVNIHTQDVEYTNGLTTVDTKFDEGFNIGGAIGKQWRELSLGSLVPRTEIEVSYTENDADRIDFSGNGPGNEVVASGSQVSSVNIMGNLLFDFENESPFTPYFGGGLGVSIINHDLIYNAAGLNLNDNGDAVFAWQVIGGVKYDLTDRVGVFFDARFRQAVDASSIRRIGSAPVAGAGGGRFEDDINSVILSSGLAVRF